MPKDGSEGEARREEERGGDFRLDGKQAKPLLHENPACSPLPFSPTSGFAKR